MNRFLAACGCLLLCGTGLLLGCRAGKDPVSLAAVSIPASQATIRFEDVAASAGLNYRWSIPGKRPLNILQTIGNGCAFLDYDNDGNLDILLVGPKLALYKGDGHGHFTDVTHETGLDRLHGHFLGCAVGDYDNDGYDDLYLSAYRGGVLLHNEAQTYPPTPSLKGRGAERNSSPAPLLIKERGEATSPQPPPSQGGGAAFFSSAQDRRRQTSSPERGGAIFAPSPYAGEGWGGAAPFQPVPLPYDALLDTDWEHLDSYAGLARGLRWFNGVPFALAPANRPDALASFPTRLAIPDARTLYVLYEARQEEGGSVSLPIFLLSDGSITPPSGVTQALAWRAWPPIYTRRLLVAAFSVPSGKRVRAIQAMRGQKVLAVTALPNGPDAAAQETEVNAALRQGAAEWQTLELADQLATQARALAAHLPENQIAILPPDSEQSPANGLLRRGGFVSRMVALSPEQLIDPAQFNAAQTPVALYLDGEDYLNTVKASGDAADALARYLKEGGTLVLLSGLPYPLYYATGPNGEPKAAPLLPRLGLPLLNTIETDPGENRIARRVSGQSVLSDLPDAFTLSGDPRLRSVDRAHLPPDVIYMPIYQVRGATGTDYGDAAALLELPAGPDGKRGRILYISNVLLRDPDNGTQIVYAVLRWLVNVVNPSP